MGSLLFVIFLKIGERKKKKEEREREGGVTDSPELVSSKSSPAGVTRANKMRPSSVQKQRKALFSD